MTALRITHVCEGSDYARVHRLLTPTSTLSAARGRKLACGRTYNAALAGSAGWTDYPEDRYGMCRQCAAR